MKVNLTGLSEDPYCCLEVKGKVVMQSYQLNEQIGQTLRDVISKII